MDTFFTIFDYLRTFFTGLVDILMRDVNIPSAISNWLNIPSSFPLIGLLGVGLVVAILIASIIKLIPGA